MCFLARSLREGKSRGAARQTLIVYSHFCPNKGNILPDCPSGGSFSRIFLKLGAPRLVRLWMCPRRSAKHNQGSTKFLNFDLTSISSWSFLIFWIAAIAQMQQFTLKPLRTRCQQCLKFEKPKGTHVNSLILIKTVEKEKVP